MFLLHMVQNFTFMWYDISPHNTEQEILATLLIAHALCKKKIIATVHNNSRRLVMSHFPLGWVSVSILLCT